MSNSHRFANKGLSAIVSHTININAPLDGLSMAVDVDVPLVRGFFGRMIYIDAIEMFGSGRTELDCQLNLVLIRGADPPSSIFYNTTIIACM